jgi:hypothetical protein
VQSDNAQFPFGVYTLEDHLGQIQLTPSGKPAFQWSKGQDPARLTFDGDLTVGRL